MPLQQLHTFSCAITATAIACSHWCVQPPQLLGLCLQMQLPHIVGQVTAGSFLRHALMSGPDIVARVAALHSGGLIGPCLPV